MRLLVDMNLSPRWLKPLADAGIEFLQYSVFSYLSQALFLKRHSIFESFQLGNGLWEEVRNV